MIVKGCIPGEDFFRSAFEAALDLSATQYDDPKLNVRILSDETEFNDTPELAAAIESQRIRAEKEAILAAQMQLISAVISFVRRWHPYLLQTSPVRSFACFKTSISNTIRSGTAEVSPSRGGLFP
jgi:hypothetical protein